MYVAYIVNSIPESVDCSNLYHCMLFRFSVWLTHTSYAGTAAVVLEFHIIIVITYCFLIYLFGYGFVLS